MELWAYNPVLYDAQVQWCNVQHAWHGPRLLNMLPTRHDDVRFGKKVPELNHNGYDGSWNGTTTYH